MLEEGADLLLTAVLRRAWIVMTALAMGAGQVKCFAQKSGEESRVHLAAQSYRLDITQQNLSAALKQFAMQTGLQVARLNDAAEVDPTVGPLRGDYGAADALERLLQGTGFTYRVIDRRTIAVVARAPVSTADQELANGRVPTPRSRPNTPAQTSEGPPRHEPTSQPLDDASLRGAYGSRATEPEVVVTGSRIQQPSGMYSPTPVTVMSRRSLEDLSSGGLIEAMSLMPQFLLNSTPTNAFSFATNAGQSFLNFRGLGPNRTLVLLDGRRVVSSSRLGSTDIGVFPTALIQRVEVVTGGASAAYGSDAVGGVANFVLDKTFEGVRAEAHGGITDRDDYDKRSVSIAGGKRIGERLHVLGSVEYEGSSSIESYDGRDWFQGWGRVTNPDWKRTGEPAMLILPNVTSTRYTFGGLINQPGSALDRLEFRPDGTTQPFRLGPIASVGMGTYSQSGGGGDNYEADRTGDGSLIPGVERSSVFTHLDYALSDDASIYAQALYGHNHIDFVHVGAVQFGQWQATIYRDNAFLPDSLRQVMQREGLDQFGFSRMASSADLARARDLVDNRTYSLTTGFQASRGGWRLGGYYQFGRNDGDTTLHDYVRTDRLSIALDAVHDPVSGGIVCRSTLFDSTNGCVPINLFGAGRASPQAIDYVLDDKYGRVRVQQHFAEISADGPIAANLGAGPILLALGASFREDSFAQSADPSDFAVTTPANDPSRGIQGISDGLRRLVRPSVLFVPGFARRLHGEGRIRGSPDSALRRGRRCSPGQCESCHALRAVFRQRRYLGVESGSGNERHA